MAERITPTGWAHMGGRQIKKLGSLRALLEHMIDGGAVIVGSMDAVKETDALIRELGYRREGFKILVDAGGPDQIYELARETYIGIHPEAFTRIPGAMWGDFYAALDSRFGWVLWA